MTEAMVINATTSHAASGGLQRYVDAAEALYGFVAIAMVRHGDVVKVLLTPSPSVN